MLKIKSFVDEQMQIDGSKKTKRLAVMSTIVGAIGVFVELILWVVFQDFDISRLALCAFLLAIGLPIWIFIDRRIKKVSAWNAVNIYEFDEDAMRIATERDGEVIGMQKVAYEEIRKAKEDEDYFYFSIKGDPFFMLTFMIGKDECSESETRELRGIMEKIEEIRKTAKKRK